MDPALEADDPQKEQLMLEAERLHREAALLSNTLADYAEADVAGRAPVVAQILALREAWKDARYHIQTGQPRRPEPVAKPAVASQGIGQAEIKLELQKIRVNISKHENKLAERPEHPKATTWQAELARLRAIKEQYEDTLRHANQ